ncbi:ArsC/Spx/MgsR family protein [Aeromicrobium sp. CTD01-1L150]|uniref:ArsC/Spx/MgsR family protein n=1 Tax=Aeromicrobium sp. CTD01-1L150 TaxID=3341830 RepID=UPI0035C1A602
MADDSLRILHHTACSTSRHAVDAARAAGAEPEVVQYLKTPLTRPEILDLLRILQDAPADLVRKDKYFKEQGLDPDAHTTPEQVADVLVQHPRLMERPVLIRGDRAIIGRPKDRAERFLRET